ncbi:hypothetical protein PI124_g3492 [Phytophthora idaei]|nr:hypothetical protein PI124_g3492 [Phytophthora idaei]
MPRRHRRQSTMDRFLVGGEAAASYRRDRWSARPLVEERCVLQALTEYEVADQNKFSCRPKRVLDEDEIPECNCHRGRDWSVTCGIGCENRSIQVECVRGSCATGGHCSNQQMQDGSNALLCICLPVHWGNNSQNNLSSPGNGVEIGHQLLRHGSDKQRGYWRPRYRWPCKIREPQLPRLIENDEEISIDYGGGNTATKRRKQCLCKEPGCRGLIPM